MRPQPPAFVTIWIGKRKYGKPRHKGGVPEWSYAILWRIVRPFAAFIAPSWNCSAATHISERCAKVISSKSQ
jgi:hypothetical protein